MVEFSISNARYTYVHDQKYPSENADMHHIVLRRSGSKYFFVYASALLVLACAIYLCFLEEKSISFVYYSLLFDIFLVKLLIRKPVNKESVVIMPAFGVQLETHYVSLGLWNAGASSGFSSLILGCGFLAVRKMPYARKEHILDHLIHPKLRIPSSSMAESIGEPMLQHLGQISPVSSHVIVMATRNLHALKFLLDTFGMIQDFLHCGYIRK